MILNSRLLFYFLLCSCSVGQTFSFKGELSANLISSNNLINSNTYLRSSFIYLPSISVKSEISQNSLIDFEYAFKIHRVFDSDSIIISKNIDYRFWLRYINQASELRIGLQKIIFGPSQILRSLSWFDGYDIKDPTSQTEGVKALRYKYFINELFSSTSWIIINDSDPLSIGGRINISSSLGEWGLTYHRDPLRELRKIGQIGPLIVDSHNRYGLDYRYDGSFGLWFESVLLQSSDKTLVLGTIGMDYTINIFNGIQILSESMIVENLEQETLYSAFLMSTSIGFLHRAMIISQVDWNRNKINNYFQWSTSFDQYSINYTFSINPKDSSYNDGLEGYGAGHQIMVIYNY